jgi:hypothetical protein
VSQLLLLSIPGAFSSVLFHCALYVNPVLPSLSSLRRYRPSNRTPLPPYVLSVRMISRASRRPRLDVEAPSGVLRTGMTPLIFFLCAVSSSTCGAWPMRRSLLYAPGRRLLYPRFAIFLVDDVPVDGMKCSALCFNLCIGR